ncbi:MAG: hypothetical protein WAQ27_01855 [Candidatus Microsaccharimonas sp.]
MPQSSKKPFAKFKKWQKDFLSRRPHRSFKLTRRRDYERDLTLPGYIAFTHFVNKTLWSYRKLLFGLAAIYLVLFGILVGIGSQETYNTLVDSLNETNESLASGDISQLGNASVLFISIATVGLTSTPTEAQQVYAVILGLLVWLTTIWLLRNKLAGHAIKLRDGLYNAGAPIISTFLVILVLLIQLIPILIAAVGYSAASATGMLAGGVEAMLFWFAASLLGLLSIFWSTSTLFGMVIVTLPGKYPMQALRSAGDIVLGRRVRILLRWVWMFLMLIIAWAIVLIPVILLEMWLKSIWPVVGDIPIVPVVQAILGTLSIIWVSGYVYLLYRKVVDERSN